MKSETRTPELKHFEKPDEVREFPKGKVEVVKIAEKSIGRLSLEPGWKWSTAVQPIVKTKSCQFSHFIYQISGTLMVQMDDGARIEIKPGDVTLVPGGHDAWVVGDEPVLSVDFQGMAEYALKKAA